MKPEKVEISVDGQITMWLPASEVSPLIVKENQRVQIRVFINSSNTLIATPQIFVEDHYLPLHRDDYIDDNGTKLIVFSSLSEKVFRESFGAAFIRLHIGEEEFAFPVEVLATKVTAAQAEQMIRYLTERREHIIRVCLSRTMRPVGMQDTDQSDPEMIISTAEQLIDTFQTTRTELRQQLRSKLVPTKIPSWKAEQSGSLIDPVDVIFNLDALLPGDGNNDFRMHGRNYSTKAIDVTTLRHDANVEENSILIGGLYSIRRVISSLMDEISGAFKNCQIAIYDKEYVSLGEMLIKLTGGAMYERCKQVIAAAENLIRMFENEFSITFVGETYPKITPYVRSSRLYRNIFEQYAKWYRLGSPTLDGDLFVIKLRSLSKIFEFFVLFRLFDYLEEHDWEIRDASLSEEFDKLIPDVMSFKKDNLILVMSYEPRIYIHSKRTQDKSLVKLPHPTHTGISWTPDYTLRIEDTANTEVRYLILDAKYSSPYWVENGHISILYEKYYQHMAVFDLTRNFISRNEIIGVFAVFPEALDQTPKPLNMRLLNFNIDGNGPVMIPMVAGLPISLKNNTTLEQYLEKILAKTLLSLRSSSPLPNVAVQ